MQNFNLGELRSVHRPMIWRIWLMALITLAPLFLIGLGVIIAIDDAIHGRASFSKLAGPLGCVGVIGLLTALLISFVVGEFRKWRPTRTVRLKIYEQGFTYEEQGRIQVCRWNEIRDITHRTIKVHSKNAAPRRVSVIRAIIKSDGTVISLAETLNLLKLTPLLSQHFDR